MKQLTSIEIAELFLVILYDLSEPLGGNRPVRLETIMEKLRMGDIVRATNVAYFLEILNYATFTASESKHLLLITEQGKAQVEAGGKTGIIGRYRESPGSFELE